MFPVLCPSGPRKYDTKTWSLLHLIYRGVTGVRPCGVGGRPLLDGSCYRHDSLGHVMARLTLCCGGTSGQTGSCGSAPWPLCLCLPHQAWMRSGLFLSPATHTPPPSMAQGRTWNCVLHKQMASRPALVIKNRAEPALPLPTSLHHPLGASEKVLDASGVCHPPYTPVSACAVPTKTTHRLPLWPRWKPCTSIPTPMSSSSRKPSPPAT